MDSPLLQDEERVPLTAELLVKNIDESLAYYTEKLGFTIFRTHTDGRFATVTLGKTFIALKEDPVEGDKSKGFFLRIPVPDLDAYYQRLQEKGAKTLGPPELRSWGAKRFYAEDPDGFKLQFIPVI